MSLKEWWDNQGFLILVILSVVFLVGCSIFISRSEKELVNEIQFVDLNYLEPKNKKKKRIYFNEEKCREAVEKIFNKKFVKIRPSWLKNPRTNKNLECDSYNEELKLCVEFHGEQHLRQNKFYHKTEEDFKKQQYRDQLKKDLCAKKGVQLFAVPHTVHSESMPYWMCQKFIQDPRLSNLIDYNYCQSVLAKGDPNDVYF